MYGLTTNTMPTHIVCSHLLLHTYQQELLYSRDIYMLVIMMCVIGEQQKNSNNIKLR